MLTIHQLFKNAIFSTKYINVEVLIIRETLRSVLIQFDGRQEWIPKSWITGYRRINNKKIRITLSEASWARKFD